ncbi:hypothetical protein PM082_016894 [Marasmius tenuissimus]|nr:hypothetical protein PM082_016894 [Marasmius tenuissimus]
MPNPPSSFYASPEGSPLDLTVPTTFSCTAANSRTPCWIPVSVYVLSRTVSLSPFIYLSLETGPYSENNAIHFLP